MSPGSCATPRASSPAPAKTYTCPEAGATGAAAYTLPEGALVQPVPLAAGAQFTGTLAYKPGAKARIAYMPPVINPYYGAIEQGAKAQAEALGVEMVTFSPSGDSDIAGQMKQLQDVATQGFDAVILSTHDENAAGPLVKRLGEAGIPVVIFNSDIANFPSPVSAVVGYAQRKATSALGECHCQEVQRQGEGRRARRPGRLPLHRAHRWLPGCFQALPGHEDRFQLADHLGRRYGQQGHSGHDAGASGDQPDRGRQRL